VKLPLDLQNLAGLWLLAALVPLVLLYVLKVRRRRQKVASTWLWSAARRDVLARSPFQRLVAQIPLLLQLLALILLALALARPATRHRAILGDHIAIVVDASASMQGVSPSGNQSVARIELARRAAADALLALTPGSDAMIVEAGREPRVVSVLDRDRSRLRAAVGQLQAHDVEGDLTAAVALAVDRLRPLGGSRRVLVFTDGNVAKAEPLRASGAALEVFTVGEPIDNAAIVRVDVRAGTDPTTKKEEVQAFAVIANFGQRPRDVFVTLRLSTIAEPLASRRLLVAPGERAPVVLTFEPTAGDRFKGLILEIAPHDGLAADDVAYGRVPPAAKQPAYLVTSSASPWLERALKSDPLVDLSKGTLTDLGKTPVEAGSLFVYDGQCPPQAPNGDFLVMAPPPGRCLGVEVADAIDKPTVTSWNNGDPRFRFLTMDGVHIAKARTLRTQNATLDLLRGPHDTLAADISTPGRLGTLLGFDVGESDWPLKASFVLFMRNIVEVARSHRALGALGPARTGDPLRVPVSSDVSEVTVDFPDAKEPKTLPAREGLAVVSDTRKAGLYRVSWKGARPGSTLLPVNLTSDGESDLRAAPLVVDASGATVAPASKLADAHTDWAYLVALAALAFLVADVAWLTRAPRRRRPGGLGPGSVEPSPATPPAAGRAA
jgi:hypothetical protein